MYGARSQQRNCCLHGVLEPGTVAHGSVLVSQPGSSPDRILWVFMEAPLQRHNSLSHWHHLACSSFCLPRSQGWNCKFQLCNHLVGSPGNQPLSLGEDQKSPHQHNKSQLYCSHHIGNSKGFRRSVPDLCQRPNTNYKSQCHNKIRMDKPLSRIERKMERPPKLLFERDFYQVVHFD